MIQRYSPFVIDGALCVHPSKVPSDKTPVEKVYVKVPVGSVGALDELLFFLYNCTTAVLYPFTPLVPVPERTVAPLALNSDAGIVSVVEVLDAVACFTQT